MIATMPALIASDSCGQARMIAANLGSMAGAATPTGAPESASPRPEVAVFSGVSEGVRFPAPPVNEGRGAILAPFLRLLSLHVQSDRVEFSLTRPDPSPT